MRPWLITLVVLAGCGGSAPAGGALPANTAEPGTAELPTAPVPALEPLAEPSRVDGCGCYLRNSRNGGLSPDDLPFLLWIEGDVAWLNLDGADRALQRTAGRVDPVRAGDRFREEFAADGYRVRIDWVVTQVCPPKDESCEFTPMTGTITADRGGEPAPVRGGEGGCGC